MCRLGSVFAELAGIYYRDEGRRIKARIERKTSNPADFNIRYSFKVSSSIFVSSNGNFIAIKISVSFATFWLFVMLLMQYINFMNF